jgi:hypothetical protein
VPEALRGLAVQAPQRLEANPGALRPSAWCARCPPNRVIERALAE